MSRSVKQVYPANPQAPTVKELEEGKDLTPYLVPSGMGNTVAAATGRYVGQKLDRVHQEMVNLGMASEQAALALQNFSDAVGSPKRELLWRLNEQVNQRDPGQPVHWRGLS